MSATCINAVVVGPFSSQSEIDDVLRVQNECRHNSHVLIADGDTTWLYRQTSSDDADHLTIEADGSVICDDSHRDGGQPGSYRIGSLVRRVFHR